VGRYEPSGGSYKLEEFWNTWRLAVRVVPPGDTCRGRESKGAWRLAACGPRQAVWKHISPVGSEAVSSNNTKAEALFALDVRDL